MPLRWTFIASDMHIFITFYFHFSASCKFDLVFNFVLAYGFIFQGLRRHLLEELEQAFPDEVESYREIRAASAAVSSIA